MHEARVAKGRLNTALLLVTSSLELTARSSFSCVDVLFQLFFLRL